MKERLEKIRTSYPHQIILLLTDDILQNPDIEDLHTLRRMSLLSLWLFVLGNKDDALYLADIVSKLDLRLYNKKIKDFPDPSASAHRFQGNGMVLCTAICRQAGDFEKAEAYWNRYLVSRLETDKWGEPREGKVARKRWKRNLETGDLVDLCITKRQERMSSGGKAFYDSTSLLEELLWMKEAGGSELYPATKLGEMIDDVSDYLRANIDLAEKDYIKFHVK